MLLISRQVQITKVTQQGTDGMNLEKSAAQLKENVKKEGVSYSCMLAWLLPHFPSCQKQCCLLWVLCTEWTR